MPSKRSKKRMKKKATNWEQVLADHRSDKEFICIYKKNSQNSVKKKNKKQTMGEDMKTFH